MTIGIDRSPSGEAVHLFTVHPASLFRCFPDRGQARATRALRCVDWCATRMCFGYARISGTCVTSCGLLLVIVGLAVMTGIDKRDETALVDLSPAWLTRLAIRF